MSRSRSKPRPTSTPGVHLDVGAPGPAPFSDHDGPVRAYSISMRSEWSGIFWLACALYLAVSPPNAKCRYIMALDALRRMEESG